MLNPSSWLMLNLQKDFVPRLLISSKDEAEAGKQKVTFLCRKDSRQQTRAEPIPQAFQILIIMTFFNLIIHVLGCAVCFLFRVIYLKLKILTSIIPFAANH